MASSNLNKIVHSNLNLKPWMLSKNTNEIVNSYIQKIYKQMPTCFGKDTKTVKVASHRPENKGPLSTLKDLQRQLPLATITPRTAGVKKSISKTKHQQHNNLMNSLKMSSKNNHQMTSKLAGADLTPSKRNLKTPNYKIYKSQRYGSSSSSSRSSILKRNDDRNHQMQNIPSQTNYLARSFHTSHCEPTYARYLMPARNQHVEGNLGSIPDAVKFSTNIIKDLMTVDRFTRHKPASEKTNLQSNDTTADVWNHAAPLDKYGIQNSKDSAIKCVKLNIERSMRKEKLSPEHRDYARINVSRVAQLKHSKPPNELFTAQHDRNNTELHEKHRRNRMKKLGLIENTDASEKERKQEIKILPKLKYNEVQTEMENNEVPLKNTAKAASKTVPALCNQPEIKMLPDFSVKTKNELKGSDPPISLISNCPDPLTEISGDLPKAYTSISPIAAARAQMLNKDNSRSYRFNRPDVFSTRKY